MQDCRTLTCFCKNDRQLLLMCSLLSNKKTYWILLDVKITQGSSKSCANKKMPSDTHTPYTSQPGPLPLLLSLSLTILIVIQSSSCITLFSCCSNTAFVQRVCKLSTKVLENTEKTGKIEAF